MVNKPARLLFLGDSVTDCDRDRSIRQPNRPEALGTGWVHRVATEWLSMSPASRIWNRGYSGCEINELLDQEGWQPVKQGGYDTITVMIGINDIWHPFEGGQSHDIATNLKDFNALAERLMPLTRQLVLVEPFAIAGTAVTEAWWPLLTELQAGQKALAEQHKAVWMPVQADFEADSAAHPMLWAYDGVHPGVLGHQWLARRWLALMGQVD
ncbi:MAG: GDSL-type esterase/lipase family protein [Saccharospirillum sp.]|uniref:GDSL-type esterase/lipase family protein n=1 Tax=Saccharospirillum sp. TaxID=2033801 RepID=UPI003296CE24